MRAGDDDTAIFFSFEVCMFSILVNLIFKHILRLYWLFKSSFFFLNLGV